MAYVVAEPCIGTKDRACVEVCPVDCFYDFADPALNTKVGKQPHKEGDVGMLVIDPDECISCGACEPECPVEAIFDEGDLPDNMNTYQQLNAQAVSKMSDADRDANRVTSRD